LQWRRRLRRYRLAPQRLLSFADKLFFNTRSPRDFLPFPGSPLLHPQRPALFG